MTNTQQTKAETYARDFAARYEAAGWTAVLSISEDAPTLYSDGAVMIPGKISAAVTVREPLGIAGDTIHVHWISWLPAEGHRATTKFMGATLYYAFRYKGRSSRRFQSLRHVGYRTGI